MVSARHLRAVFQSLIALGAAFVVARWTAPTGYRAARPHLAKTPQLASLPPGEAAPVAAAALYQAATAAAPDLSRVTLSARDANEWQGMRVDLSRQAFCQSSSGCGLAMACKDGVCGPCAEDDDCAIGEGCVLEHCLRRSSISCRNRRGCGADELCLLSGYSADPRGNRDIKSYCNAPFGGTAQKEESLSVVEDGVEAQLDKPTLKIHESLLDRLRPAHGEPNHVPGAN